MKQYPERPPPRSPVGASHGTKLLTLMLAFLLGAISTGAGIMLAWGVSL